MQTGKRFGTCCEQRGMYFLDGKISPWVFLPVLLILFYNGINILDISLFSLHFVMHVVSIMSTLDWIFFGITIPCRLVESINIIGSLLSCSFWYLRSFSFLLFERFRSFFGWFLLHNMVVSQKRGIIPHTIELFYKKQFFLHLFVFCISMFCISIVLWSICNLVFPFFVLIMWLFIKHFVHTRPNRTVLLKRNIDTF